MLAEVLVCNDEVLDLKKEVVRNDENLRWYELVKYALACMVRKM